MPPILLTASCSIDSELEANEPWPDDVQLYQPIEAEQILLPENASSLSIQAFLRMCKLKYEVVQRTNVDEMYPSGAGRVPFIKCGAYLIFKLETLIWFLNNKGITLSGNLSTLRESNVRVYMSLINTILPNAELYVTWVDKDTYNQVTKVRNSSVHPWPVGWILTVKKRRRVFKHLRTLGWLEKSIEEVYEEVDSCCTALSERLDENKYFIGDKPTELDAVVFAHVFTILTTRLPNNQLVTIVLRYSNLVNHCMRIKKEFFGGPNSAAKRLALEDNSGSIAEQ